MWPWRLSLCLSLCLVSVPHSTVSQTSNRVYSASWRSPSASLPLPRTAPTPSKAATQEGATQDPDSPDSHNSGISTISACQPTTPGRLLHDDDDDDATNKQAVGPAAAGGSDASSLRTVAAKVAVRHGAQEAAIHKAIASDTRTSRYVVPLLHAQALPSRGNSTWLIVTPLMPYIGLIVAAIRRNESDTRCMLLALLDYTVQLLEVRRPAHTPLPVCNLLSLTPPLVCMFV